MRTGIVAAMWLAVLSTPAVAMAQSRPATVVCYESYGAAVKSLDPACCGDTLTSSFQANIYQGLYQYHFLKRPVEVIPLLAAEMPKVSDDGLTWTIKLRQAVKYHPSFCFGTNADGSPKTRTVTAGDFVLAFKRIADSHLVTPMALAFIEDQVEGIAAYHKATEAYDVTDFSRYEKESISGIKAIDAQTLQIKLSRPYPQLLHVLAQANYAPIPREVIEYYMATPAGEQPAKDRRTAQIIKPAAVVGTGPFCLAKFEHKGEIVMKRHADYFGETYPAEGEAPDKAAGFLDDAGKNLPLIDELRLLYIADQEPMWNAFLAGRIGSSGISQDMYDKIITPQGQLREEYASKGMKLIKNASPAVYWYNFNMEDKVLGKSKALRQALCLAFDVEGYIKDQFNGRGTRAMTFMPSDFEGYKEAASPYAKFDLKAAKAKLDEAVKQLRADGILKPDEDLPAFTLSLGGKDEMEKKVGKFAQAQFQQLGLKLNVDLLDWPELQLKVEGKKCQIFAMGWHADYPDPENFLQLWYSPSIKKGINNSNYSNPEFDKLYEKAAAMPASPQRTTIHLQMLKILGEDCPVMLLTEPVSYVLVWDWVGNFKPHPFGYGTAKYRRIDVQLRDKRQAEVNK